MASEDPELDDGRGRHVAVFDQTAVRAPVHAIGQGLFNLGAAARALLRCAARIDGDHQLTGSLGLVSDQRPQQAPHSVQHILGQHRAGQALTGEVFDRDAVEDGDDVRRQLVQVIGAAVGSLAAVSRQTRRRLFPAFAPRKGPPFDIEG
ncbi:hypothetical protein TSH7_24880 [Azospirillum sp. TSH7]|nr:hypothetical protein TSH7_24880 [Azospirillum sp. TSH7]PWC66829.1 hypothetical protein TSH20_13980 [Azospirillum sp. TSH20]